MSQPEWSARDFAGDVATKTFDLDSDTRDYRSDRKEIHQAILRRFLEGSSTSEQQKLFLACGGAASGKTEAVKRIRSDAPDAVFVNTDEIRVLLPEFAVIQGTDKAGLLQEEAGDIRNDLLAAAFRNRFDVILDAPGSLSVSELVTLAEQIGYVISINYTHRPVEESKELSAFRAKHAANLADQRVVPDEVIVSSHRKAREGFAAMANPVFTREIRIFDKTGKKRGEEADLIYFRSSIGRVGAFDRERLEVFASCEPPSIDRSVLHPL